MRMFLCGDLYVHPTRFGKEDKGLPAGTVDGYGEIVFMQDIEVLFDKNLLNG